MKVIKADNYGYRTVVVVCHNPDDPEYLHSDGSAHPISNIHGCPNDVAGGRLCTYNHRLQDFIWDGDSQYVEGRLKTGLELWEEIRGSCPDPDPVLEVPDLIGRSS